MDKIDNGGGTDITPSLVAGVHMMSAILLMQFYLMINCQIVQS